MELSIEVIIFYLLLIDSLGANFVSWGEKRKWYQGNFRLFSRYFPATKGWTTYYFVLVVLIGIMLYRFGVLTF